MKQNITLKIRLFFAIAGILACSYALLFFTSLITLQRFIAEQSEKDLEYSLKFAKKQFSARQEMALEALQISAATLSDGTLFLEADHGKLNRAVKIWAKSLESTEMLTVFDDQPNVIARNNVRNESKSFIPLELLRTVIERKQPFMATEIVSHHNYCQEVSSFICQSLPENRDVMVQLVFQPVVDSAGKVIGVIVAGNDVNNNPHLGYQQQEVFGKTVEMLVTLREELIASTMTNEGVGLITLEGRILQPLSKGYQFQGTTALNGRDYELLAEPLLNHRGEFIGSIAVALNLDRFNRLRNENYRNLVFCGLFSIALIFVLAYVMAWKFTAPIRRLSVALQAIASGDYTTKISEPGSGEFTSFAETFNKMSQALHERDSVIMSQNAELKALNEQHLQGAAEKDLRLSAETMLQKSIIKSLVDGLIVVDDRQKIIEVNPAAEKMLGVKALELIGEPIARLYERQGMEGLEKLAKRDSGVDKRRLKFALIDLEAENECSRGFLLTIRDVTIDGEVDRLKSGFISKVSHELKTPLTAMKGSLQFILKKGKWLTGAEREMLTVCFRNTERLIGLVAGIIELSRIEAGQINFSMRPLQLGEVVLYAIEEIKSAALLRNTAVINDVPMDLPKVYGDYERLLQVLLNLLSNAVKFSPENSVVTLQTAVEKSFLTIFVADNGHVIPEEERGALFSRFQQMGRPEDGEFGGSGLGLAICREIMEKHGGSIYYEPGADGGNVFACRLPLYGAVEDE